MIFPLDHSLGTGQRADGKTFDTLTGTTPYLVWGSSWQLPSMTENLGRLTRI